MLECGSMATATVEDYVKHIYLISEASESDEASMGQVASALKVVPGTATTMVKALSEAGLASYEPRVGVRLTPQGTALALHVLRRHRLLEKFLVEVLGFDWSEVHEEAEQLEHVISDRLLERIDKRLGHPTEDPHGDPIPNAAGELQAEDFEDLTQCAMGTSFVIARVCDQNNTFLQYLAGVGIQLGEAVVVTAREASADAVTLALGASESSVTLGLNAAVKILVRPV